MRSFCCRYCLDGIYAELIIDHLHLLGFLDGEWACVESQEDAVLDDDLASPLNGDTWWWKMTEGGGFQKKVFDILNSDLKSQDYDKSDYSNRSLIHSTLWQKIIPM